MSIRVFLSTVSDEFRLYRDQLRTDLTRHNVEVKVQEDFVDLGGDTLDKLDTYIAHCDAVVHLIGDMTGAAVSAGEQGALLRKHPDLLRELAALGEAVQAGDGITYTQWEAWLALYHGKLLLTAEADPAAPRGPRFAPTDLSRTAQRSHLGRLTAERRYPGCRFAGPEQLAKHIAYTAILDLLVKDYAAEAGRSRDVAEGFIREMAGKVARDDRLDLDGMKQAVRNALDIYEREIAGRPDQTNVDAVVDTALARARVQVDRGQSGLAMATLRRAAATMQQEEAERRERFVAGVTLLYDRERDIALALYDGEAAAAAVLARDEAIHGADRAALVTALAAEAAVLDGLGDSQGSNIHLLAAIAVRRMVVGRAETPASLAEARDALGTVLQRLGERESGTARLEEAVAAFRAALEERTRDRVPLDWAWTQNNLGTSLQTLGQRESGTARLEEAVTAYRAALEERTRDRVPLDWAMTQNNLGTALTRLGERESGTARLEEAVTAYRAALEERTRDRVPLNWATTQNNLGAALQTLGGRESGTARLEEAVAAYCAALEEWTRDRVPLDWAMMQNNLGNALVSLGGRENGTVRLEWAVAAYRAALEEWTRDRVPLAWAATQNNLGNALSTLGERESGTVRLEEAVTAYRAALEELMRDRVPLDWATTQNNLGTALRSLGERESGTARLEEAVVAFRAALEERTRDRVPLDWAMTQNNLGKALRTWGEREGGTARLEEAVLAWDACLSVTRTVWPTEWVRSVENERAVVVALIATRSAGS